VLGVEIDSAALATAMENIEEMELRDEVEVVQARIDERTTSALDRLDGRFDTVVSNPPFGTKTAGIDMVFLQRAMRIAPTVYSLHKSSTRDCILKRARALGFDGVVLARMRYDLPATMRMHTQRSKDIEVDFWRFRRHQ